MPKRRPQNCKKKLKLLAYCPKPRMFSIRVPYFGATGGDTQPIDVAVSFYAKNTATPTALLTAQAQAAADYLNSLKLPDVKNVFIKNPFSTVVDPATGQPVTGSAKL